MTLELERLRHLRNLYAATQTVDIDLEPHQLPPADPWRGWVFQAGRGSGKTAAAASYITGHVNGPACLPGGMPHKMLMVAPALSDATESAVRHPTCLRSLSPSGHLAERKGIVFFVWPNGSEMRLVGVNNRRAVDTLRAAGNTCLVWIEEMASIPDLADAMSNIEFGLRVGTSPRWIGSTTPKRRRAYRDVVKRADVEVTRGSLHDNPHNPDSFRDAIEAAYGNTALGRQEIAGELLEDVEGALWTQDQIDAGRLADVPERLGRVVVAVDPPGGATEAGIVAAGLVAGACPCGGTDLPHAVVTDDYSLFPSGPNHWAAESVRLYADRRADKVVGEQNYGGDMVVNTIRNLDNTVNTGTVHASRGKIVRAEPVAGLYGDPARPETWPKARVHHVGVFPELEDEMTSFTQADAGKWSPNRLDALVWAITELNVAVATESMVPQPMTLPR